MMINEVFSTSTPVVGGICRFSFLINLRANEVSTSCQHQGKWIPNGNRTGFGIAMGLGMETRSVGDGKPHVV